ncbi:GNAT family N-acetyltransferase [Desmospora activa]|uniref:Putative acetyltransferase n=1 Tax=Desmospora activa DSM 45169 TaxID=1121389 RepID=A0A2T4Z7J9_9BACL|nr:N-acetyltransferase [Desmospora activa]PTM57845.1 putative acetyltransferase [Desmospora activa DSM 45169]
MRLGWDLKIREEKSIDLRKIKEINDLAFGRETESNIVDAIRKSPHFIPQLSLIAETGDGEVVGHILFSIISIQTKEESVKSLVLAPMAITPKYQSQGVGSTLIREGLNRCGKMGFKHVVVLGHPNYYPRFGFIPAITKGIKAPFEVPNETFMVCELKKNSLEKVHGTVQFPEPLMSV